MNLRFGVCFATAVLLAACGQVLSGNPSSGLLPSATAGRGQPLLRPEAKATPAYSIAIVLPDRAMQPNEMESDIGSVRATTYVVGVKKAYSYKIKTAPSTCEVYGTGHTIKSDCEILFAGTTELDIKKATFMVYKHTDAKGCVLATATFKGDAADGTPVATKFQTTKRMAGCWK
jgi:hypothetical protein